MLSDQIKPLLQGVAPEQRGWLSVFLQHQSTYRTYQAVENEFFIQRTGSSNALMVTSTLRREGRTSTAVAIACLSALFQPHKRILLIDADFENGSLHTLLGLDVNSSGLAEYFEESNEFSDCIHATNVPGLYLTPVSNRRLERYRLSSNRFQSFLNQAQEQFDLIVVDSSAGSTNNDVTVLASIIKQVVLVIKYQGVTLPQINEFLSNLHRVDTNVLGSVLNQRKFSIPKIFYGAGGG